MEQKPWSSKWFQKAEQSGKVLGGAVVATAFAGSKLSPHNLSYQCEMSCEKCVLLPNCLVALQMNQNQSKEVKTTTNQVMWSYFSIVMVD